MLTGAYPFLMKDPISFNNDKKFIMEAKDVSGTWKIIEQEDNW